MIVKTVNSWGLVPLDQGFVHQLYDPPHRMLIHQGPLQLQIPCWDVHIVQ